MLEYELLHINAYWSMVNPCDFVFKPSMRKLSKKLFWKLTYFQKIKYFLFRLNDSIKFPNYWSIMYNFEVGKEDARVHANRGFNRLSPVYKGRMTQLLDDMKPRTMRADGVNFRDFPDTEQNK